MVRSNSLPSSTRARAFVGYLIGICALGISVTANAASFTSTQTGTFNIGTTWGNGCAAACTQGTHYPGTNDSMTVATGHIVTVTATPGQSVTAITINLGGTLTINTGVTLTGTGNYLNNGINSGAGALTLSGNGTTIDGTGTNSLAGLTTLTNNKTVQSTANLAFSGAMTISAATIITQNGTISVTGTLTVTGTMNNNSSVTTIGTLTGGGSWTQGTNAVLTAGGATTNAMNVTTVNLSANGNIVNYNANGNQTCKLTNYYTLEFSTTGAKTCALAAGTQSVQNVTLRHSATWTLSAATTISGTLTVGQGTTVTKGNNAAVNLGSVDVTGTLNVTTVQNTIVFNNMTINAGGVVNFSVNEATTISGNLQVDGSGSLTTGSGGWTFNAAGGGSLNGTATNVSINAATFSTAYNNSVATLTLVGTTAINENFTNNSAGVISAATVNIASSKQLINNGRFSASGTITVTGSVTNNGTVTANSTLTGGGSWTQGIDSVLIASGATTNAMAVTTVDFASSSNTVYYALANAQTCKNAQYYNLTFAGSGAKTCTNFVSTILGDATLGGTASWTLGSSVAVNGNLTLSGGTLNTSASSFRLDLGGNMRLNSGTFTVNSSTVAFTGSSTQNINNNGQAFWVLVDSNTSAGGVTFASGFTAASLTIDGNGLNSPTTAYFNAGSTFQITTLRLLGGSSTERVWIRSTADNTAWILNNTSTNTVAFVDVKDSDARSGVAILANDGGSQSAGNNLNWVFGIAPVTRTWWGGSDTNWWNAANWDSGIPTADDSVLIVSTASVMPVPITNLTMYGLTITGSLTTAGFAVAVNGPTHVFGTLTLTNTTGNKSFIGLVTVQNGGVLNTNTANTTFNDVTITNGGTIQVPSITGSKAFNGTLTIDGDMNVTAAETVNINGNLALNGTISGASSSTFVAAFATPGGNGTLTGSAGQTTFGTPTFTTTYTNSANLQWGTLTITGTTLTNNGTITVLTSITGTGGLTNAAGGTLNLSFTGTPAITTLTATAAGNTVNYNFPGTQTCKNTQYSNLTFSGTSAKTCTTFTSPVLGDVTMSGTASWLLASSVTINGDLLMPGGSITTAGFALWVTGSTDLTGTLTLTNATGNKNFEGTVTVNNGGILNTNTAASIFDGAVTVSNGGTIQFPSLTGSKTFNGTLTIAGDMNVTANETVALNGDLVLDGTVSGASSTTFLSSFAKPGGNGTITGSAPLTFFGVPTFTTTYTNSANLVWGTLTINGTTLTNNGIITVNTSLTGTGGFTNDTGGTLIINFTGTAGITTLTATAAGNLVQYSFAGTQTCKNAQYYNLTFAGSGAKTCTNFVSTILGDATLGGTASWTLGSSVAVNGNLTLSGGTLNTSASSFRIDLGGDLQLNSGTFTVNLSTVVFIGTSAQNINNAGQAFWVLIDSNTSSGGVTFASGFTAASLTIDGIGLNSPTTAYFNAGSTFQITTLRLLGGSSSERVWIRSTADNTAWILNNTSTHTIAFVDVRDSDARTGIVIMANDGGSQSAGNNLNWVFGTAPATRTWWGGSDTNWWNAANWDSGIPTADDSVLIVSTASVMPVPTTNLVMYGLRITGSLTTAGFTFAVNGPTSLSGTLTLTNTTGNKTFNGLVTVQNGGVLNTNTATTTFNDMTVATGGTIQFPSTTGSKTFNGIYTIDGDMNVTAAETVNINGDLVLDGTVSGASSTTFLSAFAKPGGTGSISGSATQTFFGFPTFTTAYSNSANLIWATLTITATTLTNNGTITVTSALNGTGNMTNGTGGILNINFTGTAAITTLTANAVGNTVNYGFPGTQTCKNTQYYNLTFSSTGAKTCTAFTSPILGDLTMDQTATWTLGSSVTVNGNLEMSSGTLTTGAFAFWVTGATNINGGLVSLASNTGAKTIVGLVTVNGGTLNGASTGIVFQGGIAQSAGTVSLSGTATFNTNDQVLSGTQSITTLTVASGITLTNNGTLTTAGTLTVTGGFTNNGTVNANSTLTGGGTWTQGNDSILNASGAAANAMAVTNVDFASSSNTVNYALAGVQTCKNAQYYNLVFGGSGAKTCTNFVSTILGDATLGGTASWTLGSSVAVTGHLTLSGGTLNTSASSFRLDLGGDLRLNSGTFTVNQSTVALIGTSGQTLNNNTQAFWVLIDSNTSTGGVTFASRFTAFKLVVDGAGLNSATTVYFLADSTFTITSLVLAGENINQPVFIRSFTDGTYWYLNASTYNVTAVNVKDSEARQGSLIIAANSIDGTNNLNWNFGGAGRLKTWWGNINTSWFNPLNWDAGLPSSQDSALIVTTATNYPALTSAVTVSSLTVNSTASLTLNGNFLTVSSFTLSGMLVMVGTETVSSIPNFLAGSTVSYNSAGTSIVQSTWPYRNLWINGIGSNALFNIAGGSLTIRENLTLTGGTLDPTATFNYTIGISSHWVNTAGSFTARSSTVTLIGSSAGLTIRSRGFPFANLHVLGSGYWTLVDSMTLTSTMTLTNGSLDASINNLGIFINGSWTDNGGTFLPQASTVTFATPSAGSQTVTTSGSNFSYVHFNGVSGYWTLGSSLTAVSTLTLTNGTLDASSANCNGGSCDQAIGGSWFNPVGGGGVFYARTSTTTFTVPSVGSQTITTDAKPFGHVHFNGSGGYWTLLDSMTATADVAIAAGTLDTRLNSNFGIAVGGNWAITGGDFQVRASTVLFNAGSSGKSIRSNAKPFSYVQFNGSGGYWTLSDSMTVISTMTLTLGTLDSSINNCGSDSCSLAIGGSWFNPVGGGGVYYARTSTTTFTTPSVGSQTITSDGNPFNHLHINASGGYWTLLDSMTVSSILTLTLGRLDTRAGSHNKIWLGGSWVNTGGAFNVNNSTVTFAATDAQSIRSRGFPFSMGLFGQTTTGGFWTLVDSFTVSTATLYSGNTLDLANQGLNISSFTIAGNLTLRGTETGTIRNLVLGSGPALLAGSTVAYNATSGSPIVLSTWTYRTLEINGGSGVTFTQWVNALTVNEDLRLVSGILDPTSSNLGLTIGNNWLNTGGAFLPQASTVTFNGSATSRIQSGNSNFGYLRFNGSGYWTLSDSMTVTSTMTLTAGTLDVSASNCGGLSCPIAISGGWFNPPAGSGLFYARNSTVTFLTPAVGTQTLTTDGMPFNHLYLNGAGGYWTLGSSLTVVSTLTITRGTLNTHAANHYPIELGGNWTSSNNTSFVTNFSTVSLVGSAGQIIRQNGQNFWVLVDSNVSQGGVIFGSSFTATKLLVNSASLGSPTTVYFNTGSTFTITTLLMNGGLASRVWIRPHPTNQVWLLNNVTTNTVSYVDVAYSSASAGKVITAGANSIDSDNNTNWTFRILSVTLSPNSYDFTSVNLGASTLSVSPVTVTNSGNADQTYSLTVATTGATVWGVKTELPTIMDRFVLQGVFNSGQPSASVFTDFDIMTSTPAAASASVFSGNQTGDSVPSGAGRSLWLGLTMPPYTSTEAQQSMSITVTASP